MSEEKELNLEENFSRLDQLVELLESEDISLGMEVVKRCNERIDRVEKQVLKLGSGGQLEEFEYGSAGI